MKMTCARDALLTACQIVQGATAKHTTMPILANIKAVTRDDALTLMATDSEIGIRYELRGVKVQRAGAAILSVTKLISILRGSSEPEITIDAGEETTSIKLSSSKYELPAGVPDEFPDIQEFDSSARYHEIKAGVLRTMIRRTVFAAEKRENTRYAVTGILWEAEKGRARLVATDTKRLAMTDGPADIHGGEDAKPQSHLIPLKAIQLLERNLSDDGELIRVSLNTNDARFQTERAMIYTKLVEGRFPPYQQFIPKKMAVKLTLPAAEFFARIRQAAITTDDESKRVDFHFEPGKLTLQARGPETGSSEVEMALPGYDGPEIEIAFDPAYLTEMLRATDGEPTLLLEMTEARDRAIFRIGEHYLYLVVPMVG